MNQNFPEKYLARTQEIIPEKEERELFLKNVSNPLPKTIRHSHPLLDKNIPQKSLPENWELSPVASIPDAYFIQREDQKEKPLGKTLEHFTGQIYVQSLSSMLPPLLLNPQPGEKVIDICAAPGSKSTMIAEMMNNTGTLICNEPSSSRSKKLASNLARLGTKNTLITQSDGTQMHKFYGQEFDRVLLDAPCSSEGFSRRDSQFFQKMWSEKKIFAAAKLQKQLIESAYEILAPDGLLLYSTCTSAPEENELVLKHLLQKYPEAELLPLDLGDIPSKKGLEKFQGEAIPQEITENVRRLYPHLESEGWSSESFFVSLIRKTIPIKKNPPHKPEKIPPLNILKKNHNAEIRTKISKQFGIPKDVFSPHNFIEKNGEFYCTTKSTAQFCKKNYYRTLGLKTLDKDQNPTTTFALTHGHLATQNIIQITKAQKDRWLQGYDLFISELDKNLNTPATPLPKGEVGRGVELEGLKDGQIYLIKFGDFCLGYGKIQKNTTIIKNKLDRNLILN